MNRLPRVIPTALASTLMLAACGDRIETDNQPVAPSVRTSAQSDAPSALQARIEQVNADLAAAGSPLQLDYP